MKKLFAVIISLSLTGVSYTTSKYDLVNDIVTDIAKHNIYESATIGFAATPSTQHMRLNQLLMLAADNQLIGLTKHNNAVVRLYALHAIIKRKLPVSSELRDQFYKDFSLVVTLQGCIGNKTTVSVIGRTILSENTNPQ